MPHSDLCLYCGADLSESQKRVGYCDSRCWDQASGDSLDYRYETGTDDEPIEDPRD